MPPRKELYKEAYNLGQNTRDNPSEIPFNSGQVMQNIFPGDRSPRPRNGFARWNTYNIAAEVDEIIPWDDDEIILFIGGDFYSMQEGSGAHSLIYSAGIASDTKIAWIRVRSQIYVITNDNTNPQSFIISKNSAGNFIVRNGNIAHIDPLLVLTPTSPGNITADKFVYYITTWVNRNDADSVDISGDPQLVEVDSGVFHPGILESSPDSSLADYVTNASAFYTHLSWIPLGTIDPQVTHLRIYRTEEGDTVDIAESLTKRWIADVPVVGPNAQTSYDDNFLNAVVAGALDTFKVADYNDIPSGSTIFYHQGHLWIGGVVKNQSNETVIRKGRWYYSQVPLDIKWPDKWHSFFLQAEYFKDTSLEDFEDGSVITLSENDLIFFNAKSTCWRLRNGDPDLEPENISASKGCPFRFGVSRSDEYGFALTSEGPAVIESGRVLPLEEFTDNSVWPSKWNGGAGYFMDAPVENVRCFYFRNTWWIADGSKWIGMYMPDDRKSGGPMTIVPGDSGIIFKRAVVLSPTKCVVLTYSDNQSRLWSFLDSAVYMDNGTPYELYFKSKNFYINKRDPDLMADFHSLLMNARYTDHGAYTIQITTDFQRIIYSTQYKQMTPSDPMGDQLNPNISMDSPIIHVKKVPIPDGVYGRMFTIEWWKKFESPFDFEDKGFRVQFYIVSGFDFESIDNSLITEEVILWLTFDESTGLTAKDISGHSRHHDFEVS